jgi:hypothetical protein
METVERLFLKASSSRVSYDQFCAEINKTQSRSANYYGFNVCYRSDWKNSTEDLMDQLHFSNEAPHDRLRDDQKAYEMVLSWLARHDGSPVPFIDLIKCERPNDASVDGPTKLEIAAVGKLRSEGIEIPSAKAANAGEDGELPCAEGGFADSGANQPYGSLRFDNQMSVWLMRSAFSAVPENELPEKTEGFDSRQVLEFLRSWLTVDSSLAYVNRETTFYSVPALTVLARQYRAELTHLFVDGWVSMPLETSSLWAIQEMSIASDQPIEAFAFATPHTVFIQRSSYVEFMRLFRGNKQALAGDVMAEAIQKLQAGLSSDLAQLRSAVERNGQITESSLASLGDRLGPSLKSIKNAAWLTATIQLLRFL